MFNNGGCNQMKIDLGQKPALLYRTLLALAMIAIAAALRIAPHPWNFTPIGAMALFSGAILKDRRLALLFPLVALFAGDLFVGLYNYKVMLVVYASFLISVAIGFWLRRLRTTGRIALGTLAGAVQFFLLTNFAVWATGLSYQHNFSGLVTCYLAGLPFFWNTLAGDAAYALLLFGGFALAERLFPVLGEEMPARSAF
jgi:hypothetical protein